MSITPADLFDAGDRQLTNVTGEVDLRNAIGRFYYAAYHRASEYHLTLAVPGKKPQSGGMHRCLCEQLKSPNLDREDSEYHRSRKMGYLLSALLAKRIKADYDMGLAIGPYEAPMSKTEAQNILRL